MVLLRVAEFNCKKKQSCVILHKNQVQVTQLCFILQLNLTTLSRSINNMIKYVWYVAQRINKVDAMAYVIATKLLILCVTHHTRFIKFVDAKST